MIFNFKSKDLKLGTSFFKVLHSDTIFGKILDADGGKGVLELIMNDIANDVAFAYSQKKRYSVLDHPFTCTVMERTGST
ncbi:MAG: hypothetical protein ACI815_000417 [Psychroserpens sp.]|jgi:hypothetical protein